MAEIRSTAQRDKHRAEVAELTLKGKTQYEIAELLGVSAGTVSRDLAFVRAEWREQAQAAVAEQMALEVAKINVLERTHWDAWEESKDPRHLTGVGWCIERRCSIYGVDAPKKIAPTTPDGQSEYDPISRAREQLVGKLTAVFAAIGATAVSTGNQ